MRIVIAERLKPFSHCPGTFFMLPGTPLRFQLFPALIRVHDLSASSPVLIAEIPLKIKGPLNDFTILQDLEKGFLHVWGHTLVGFLRYQIFPSSAKNGFSIFLEKSPEEEIIPQEFLVSSSLNVSIPTERLSLGNHKKQEWTLMHRRCDLTEIFPLWLRLGQLLKIPERKDSDSLLQRCQDSVKASDRNAIISTFNNLFLAGFEGGLSPRSTDLNFQGFNLPPLSSGVSPLHLLTEGAKSIRQIFLNTSDNKIAILPVLPSEFHCGRLIQAPCSDVGLLDMEWSKHLIRRMVLTVSKNVTLQFSFQKELGHFRLRAGYGDNGQKVICGDPITFQANQAYFFDRFEK